MVGPSEHMQWDLPESESKLFWYDGPSGAGPWVIWQQPHPIIFAEMAYRATPLPGILDRYNQTITDTADFMADFILQGKLNKMGCYSLGPPMYTAEIESFEGKPATAARDGTFELVYWRFGLSLAIKWRERQGLECNTEWVKAVEGLCTPLPRAVNGTGKKMYYPYNNYSTPFAPGYAVQLFAHALVPSDAYGASREVMAETMLQARATLDITRLPWCSDPPLYAMAAARLGMVDLAAEFLLQPNGVCIPNTLTQTLAITN